MKKPRMSAETAARLIHEQNEGGITNSGITALVENRAHDALGLPGFADLCEGPLAPAIARLNDDERREIAIYMRNAGCSIRTASLVTGWSHTKVVYTTRDEMDQGDSYLGADGVRYKRRQARNYPTRVLEQAWNLRVSAENLAELTADRGSYMKHADMHDELHQHLMAAAGLVNGMKNNLD